MSASVIHLFKKQIHSQSLLHAGIVQVLGINSEQNEGLALIELSS